MGNLPKININILGIPQTYFHSALSKIKDLGQYQNLLQKARGAYSFRQPLQFAIWDVLQYDKTSNLHGGHLSSRYSTSQPMYVRSSHQYTHSSVAVIAATKNRAPRQHSDSAKPDCTAIEVLEPLTLEEEIEWWIKMRAWQRLKQL